MDETDSHEPDVAGDILVGKGWLRWLPRNGLLLFAGLASEYPPLRAGGNEYGNLDIGHDIHRASDHWPLAELGLALLLLARSHR